MDGVSLLARRGYAMLRIEAAPPTPALIPVLVMHDP